LPPVLFPGWAEALTVSGVAAVFILCNSLAGLAGNFASVGQLPPQHPLYAAAVLAGAMLGSQMASNKLPSEMILKALGAVLVIAGGKLISAS
jgi:uncharacterized protein